MKFKSILKTLNVSVSFILIMTMVLFFPGLTPEADAMENKLSKTLDTYQPLNIALLMDASLSIKKYSDKDLVSREAAKAFLNCVPSTKNRVSLFQYNDKLYPYADLTTVDSFDNVKMLNRRLSQMTDCKSETHMLSAIKEANEYLNKNSIEGYKNVIVVFTDGAETKELNSNSTDHEIEEKIDEIIGDSDNHAAVYSVAFDYEVDKGRHSINKDRDGIDGYGKKILDYLAAKTGGKVMVTELGAIDELDDKFQAVIHDLCNIAQVKIDEYKGDGQTHETAVDIDKSVIEADIRIACDTADAAKNAKIRLITPDSLGKREVVLSDEGDPAFKNIWYNVDKLSANIKIINPEVGQWKIVVDNLKSDKMVTVSLVTQYNMSIDAVVTTKSGNPKQAYLNEKVKLNVKLTSDGEDVKDKAFYEIPDLEAYAYVTSGDDNRMDLSRYTSSEMLDNFSEVLRDRPLTKEYELKYDGNCFTGEIPMENEGNNVIGVWVSSGRFYCYADDNIDVIYEFSPVHDKKLNDIDMKCGEVKTIGDILSYCTYDDADFNVSSSDEKSVKVSKENNAIKIEGVSVGTSDINLKFTSNKDNKSFDMGFKANVKNAPPASSKKVNEIEMIVGDEHSESNILKNVKDPEGDKVSVVGVKSDHPDIASVSNNADNIKIQAVSVGDAVIGVEITDGFNKTTITYKVTVKQSPIVIMLIILGCLLLLALIIALILFMRKKSRRLRSVLYNTYFVIYNDGRSEKIESDKMLNMFDSFYRADKITMYKLIDKLKTAVVGSANAKLNSYIEGNKQLIEGFSRIFIIGGYKSTDFDTIKGSDKAVSAKVSGGSDDIETYPGDPILIHPENGVPRPVKYEFVISDENGKQIFKFGFECR